MLRGTQRRRGRRPGGPEAWAWVVSERPIRISRPAASTQSPRVRGGSPVSPICRFWRVPAPLSIDITRGWKTKAPHRKRGTLARPREREEGRVRPAPTPWPTRPPTSLPPTCIPVHPLRHYAPNGLCQDILAIAIYMREKTYIPDDAPPYPNLSHNRLMARTSRYASFLLFFQIDRSSLCPRTT